MADEIPKSIRALTLRLAGADYDGIAAQLQITRGEAEAFVDAELAKLQRPDENTDRLDLARLDTMLMSLWPKVRAGDVKAVTEAGKIMDRKRALSDQMGRTPKEKSDLDKARERRAERLGPGA